MDAEKPARLRSSERREAVYRFVAAHRGHPTAEEILAGVRKSIPGVGLATIYRNLDVLVGEGRLARSTHSGIARYDAHTDAHHHFVCESCGSVTNVDLELPPDIVRSVARRARANVRSVSIELRGLCGACR